MGERGEDGVEKKTEKGEDEKVTSIISCVETALQVRKLTSVHSDHFASEKEANKKGGNF